MTQSRWKSAYLWGGLVSQTLALLQLAGVFNALGLDFGLVGDIAAGVLQILVFIGILNNPTDAKNW